jgi:TatD DNase family protein
MFFDTHCHLQHKQFDRDREEVIERALRSGVNEMLVCGFDLPSSREGMALVRGREGFHASCGIHPHDASTLNSESIDSMRALSKDVVAIGEIGLDYYRDLSPREVQGNAFRMQIELARDLDLPIIVHIRNAHAAAMEILNELGGSYRGVMHCFSGGVEDAADALRLGFYISFSGSITFRPAEFAEVVKFVHENRLLIETDAPYLAPVPHRGKRNEPGYLPSVAEKVALFRGWSLEDVARICRVNGRLLFHRKLPAPSVVYRIGGSLYLNVTNRCTNHCSFCIREKTPILRGYNLRLGKEPSEEDLFREIGDPREYQEIVFCGYGEPLTRLGLVRRVAARLKERGARIRVNTNGQANLIHGRDIVPEIAGLVDEVSISLNAESPEKYLRLCKPEFGANAYNSMIDFTKRARREIGSVTLTVVGVPGVNVAKCRRLANTLDCRFKIRRPFAGERVRQIRTGGA